MGGCDGWLEWIQLVSSSLCSGYGREKNTWHKLKTWKVGTAHGDPMSMCMLPYLFQPHSFFALLVSPALHCWCPSVPDDRVLLEDKRKGHSGFPPNVWCAL